MLPPPVYRGAKVITVSVGPDELVHRWIPLHLGSLLLFLGFAIDNAQPAFAVGAGVFDPFFTHSGSVIVTVADVVDFSVDGDVIVVNGGECKLWINTAVRCLVHGVVC